MKKRQNLKFLILAGVALFMLPMAAPSFADDSGGNSDMHEAMKNPDSFDDTLAEQQQDVMQQLDELKEKTKVTHEPLVKQEDAPYFKTPEPTPPVAEEPAPDPTNYVYKKKSRTNVPSRSFNNVQ